MISRRSFNKLAAGTATGALAFPVVASSQETITWKIQSVWPAGTVNQRIFEDFCEHVKTLSNGRLVIEPSPVGTIVGYTETLDAVSNGILDGQQSGPAAFAGKEPAFALLGDLNGGFENPYQMQMWMEYGGGKELTRKGYEKFGVYYVGPIWWGVESIPSKQPIRGMADLKGIKMRVPEGLGADILRRAGVGVVTLPGSEVFTSLERGVIDATDWGTLGMNTDMGLIEIAPYPIYPGFHSMPAGDVAINMDRWNALSPDLQAIVETATRDFARDMIQRIAVEDMNALPKAREQATEFVEWPDEERRKFRELAREVWAEWAQKSELANEVFESEIAFLQKLRLLN